MYNKTSEMSTTLIKKNLSSKFKKQTLHKKHSTSLKGVKKSGLKQDVGKKKQPCHKWMKAVEFADQYEMSPLHVCRNCHNSTSLLFIVHSDEDGYYDCHICGNGVRITYLCFRCKKTETIDSDDE